MYKEPLTHSLHCSEFVELTLIMKSILDLRDFESLSANEQIHLVGAFSPIEVAVSSDSDDTSDHDDTSNHNDTSNHHDHSESYDSISQQEVNGI